MKQGGDRDRGPAGVRVAGVGLGLLGATVGGVAGWYTLASAATGTTTAAVSTTTGTNGIEGEGIPLVAGSGRPHTRTGGT